MGRAERVRRIFNQRDVIQMDIVDNPEGFYTIVGLSFFVLAFLFCTNVADVMVTSRYNTIVSPALYVGARQSTLEANRTKTFCISANTEATFAVRQEYRAGDSVLPFFKFELTPE